MSEAVASVGDGVAVSGLTLDYWPPADLVPNPSNSRKHSGAGWVCNVKRHMWGFAGAYVSDALLMLDAADEIDVPRVT